jgi:competence protein ComGC
MNDKGFTLIEMLIVLLVISILLIITIPNVTKHNSVINNKGCGAFVKMVEGQVQAYKMEHDGTIPTLDELMSEGYIKSRKCPNGNEITIDQNGKVSESSS